MFVSCFYFFYSYFVYLHFFLFLFIYLVSIFFSKKNYFFYYTYFYLDASLKFALQEDHPDGCCKPPAGPVGECLPWPPYPCLALFVTTDKQTPLLLLYIRCLFVICHNGAKHSVSSFWELRSLLVCYNI
jgi:hypothetical protein